MHHNFISAWGGTLLYSVQESGYSSVPFFHKTTSHNQRKTLIGRYYVSVAIEV